MKGIHLDLGAKSVCSMRKWAKPNSNDLTPFSGKFLRLTKVSLLIITSLTIEVIRMTIRRTRRRRRRRRRRRIVIGMIILTIAKQSLFILANKIKNNSSSSGNNVDINKPNACHTVMPLITFIKQMLTISREGRNQKANK